MTKLLLATRNAGKLAELRRLLEAAVPGVEVVGLRDVEEYPEAPETGATFAENALLKATAAAEATGRPALADDSGIVAEALGGEPGIHSARYAGEGASDQENLAKLLERLRGRPDRRAAYVCAIAFMAPGFRPELFEARCEGVVIDDPRGSGGFGYDPAFVPVDLPDGRTMAELSAEEKDAISHRGRAARAMRAWLEAAEGRS
jgi:XTP/dITP diphosphohydrolase